MSERKISFDDIVKEYLEYQIEKKDYNANTIQTLATSVLENFIHVQNPTGYYISKIKNKIIKFGNTNESIAIAGLNSFLLSTGHLNVKYYKNKTKYSKETTGKKMKQLFSQINSYAKKDYQLLDKDLDNINEKILKTYYTSPTIKIK